MTTHYARLGVAHDASTEQIRQAYRALARVHHPDRLGSSTSAEMLEINEAWRILSDPILRRAYDTRLASPPSNEPLGTPSHRPMSSSTYPMNNEVYGRARFPWRFVLGFFLVVTAIIIVMGALTEQGQPAGVDNIIRVGSCVDVDRQLREAWEVSCDGPHEGRVQQMVPFDASCPRSTEGFRDRQGLGLVCIASS